MTSRARPDLQRIVVVGDGQTGVLAALALKQALPLCEVTVVAAPPHPAAFADRACTALPFSNRLHHRLGITERDLVREAGGSYRLITRMAGWGGPEQQYCFAHGGAGTALPAESFGQRWGGGARGESVADAPASLAQVLAEQGRFTSPFSQPHSALHGVEYAMRWQPDAYRDLLIRRAQQARIGYASAPITAHDMSEQGVSAILLEDGTRLQADLYLDCSGPSARLMSQLAGFMRDDWSASLPLRAIGYAMPGEPMLVLEDRTAVAPHGWVMQIAGRDGLQTVHGLAEPADNAVPLCTSAMRENWLGNVIAIGDASAQFEPLGHFNLDLAHRQIDLLLELLPGRAIHPLERSEYNRRAAMMAAQVRDTLGLYYAAPAANRQFGPLVQSDRLAGLIDQFTRRGRIPFAGESPLPTDELRSLIHALGFRPGSSALARAGATATEAFASRAEAAVRNTPPYAQWLSRVIAG